MAQTASQAAQQNLAENFRQQQAFQVAWLLLQIVGLWGLLDLRDVIASWPQVRTAIAAIIIEQSQVMGQAGNAYYQQVRATAGVLGLPPVLTVPPPPTENLIRATLDSTGPYSLLARIKQGRDVPEAAQVTGAMVGAAATRLIQNGARTAVLQAVQQDSAAVAWYRVTAADPCAFCALLASRGPVFKTEQSAGFKAHSRCVPAGTLVQGPATEAAYRRWYEGELVVIRTAGGYELPITPNHPVLTTQGWIPAGLLHVGDDVLSGLGAQWSAPDGPHEQQRPSLIEDVWRSLSMRSLVRMPVAPEDFHGDGSDGEVSVVYADRLLAHGADSVLPQPSVNELLVPAGAAVPARSLASPRDAQLVLQAVGDAPAGSVGRNCGCSPRLGRHAGGAEQVGLTDRAQLDARGEESPPDGRARGVEPGGQFEFRNPLSVELADLVGRQIERITAGRDTALREFAAERAPLEAKLGGGLVGALAAHEETYGLFHESRVDPVRPGRFDPPASAVIVDGRDSYARLGAGLRERLAGSAQTDRIVDLSRRVFAGHVYNLQSEEGWYEASGIIVSNCRCTAAAVFSKQDARALKDNDLYRQWKDVTRGYGGQEAIRVWRRYWDAKHPEAPGVMQPVA